MPWMSNCGVLTLLGAVVAALLVLVVLYATGPGRRFRHALQYRWFRKIWQSGRAAVNLRVIDGTQEGLTGRRWFGGTALATPGRIGFTMYVGGLPLVKRPIPDIEIVAVGRARPVAGIEKWKLMDPDYQIAVLRTPTATLEIAVVPPVPAEDVLVRLRLPEMPQL
jgi:hypothetical protein